MIRPNDYIKVNEHSTSFILFKSREKLVRRQQKVIDEGENAERGICFVCIADLMYILWCVS